MICSFCYDNVLESGKSWDYHHREPSTFQDSQQKRCIFCVALAKALGNDFHRWFGSPGEAVYRWSIREAARTRESRSSVCLTFRPVSQAESGPLLPVRTFHLLPEQDLGAVPEADQLGNRTDSEESWSQVARWIANCTKNHPRCLRKHVGQSSMPTRLLDVGPPDSTEPPDLIRVVETEASGVHAPYVTLSHCWGPNLKFVQLRNDNVKDFTSRGVPWASLCTNRNFVEAMQVARRLGIRYIWIDSLCIIQAQPGKKDFNKEAPLMHAVYRNSYCNIAASDSPDKDGGLFRDRSMGLEHILPPRYIPTKPSILFGSKTWRVVSDNMYQDELLGGALYSRGWVFQERLLSPRLLHFSSSQIFWDCASLTANEGLPSGLPPAIDTQPSTDRHWRERLQHPLLRIRDPGDASIEDFWRAAVRYYTACNLTDANDRLSAIYGVAKLVGDALSEDFGGGLWSGNLAPQLAWRVVDPARAERTQTPFPSWSWASVRGPVEVGGRVPAVPVWWAVTGHDAGEIRFTLEKALHRRENSGGLERWVDELAVMARNISRAEAIGKKRAEAIRKKEAEAIGKKKAEAMGKKKEMEVLVAPRAPDTASQEETKEKEPYDLKSQTIAIQGHVIHGALKRSGDGESWSLTVAGLPEGDTGAIEAFPDIAPKEQEGPCHFVVLTAGRCIWDRWSTKEDDEDEWEEEDMQDATYSGVGIMVRKVEGDRFRRTGAFTFDAISHAGWVSLRRSCCKWDGTEGEHGLEDGQQFWVE